MKTSDVTKKEIKKYGIINVQLKKSAVGRTC